MAIPGIPHTTDPHISFSSHSIIYHPPTAHSPAPRTPRLPSVRPSFASDRKATEFGADIRFFNNRIGLDLTHYHYKNTGIVYQNTSPASGFSSNLTNGNVYTNDGWEAVVTGKPFVDPKGFSWMVTANFFTYIRKWVSNSNPDNWEFNGKRIDLNYGDGFVRTPDGKLVIDPSSGVYIRYSDLGSSAEQDLRPLRSRLAVGPDQYVQL